MKTLVVASHPGMQQSRISKAWLHALAGQPGVTVSDLASKYPSHDIDILEEQALMLAHDRYVLLFPLQWYSAPPLLKSWIDAVLQPGFAYAAGGDKLHGKEWFVCTSAGGSCESYRAGGDNRFTIDELLRPLEQMVYRTGGIYRSPFCLYRALLADHAEVERSARTMVAHVLRSGIDPARELAAVVDASFDAMVERAGMD